MTRQIEPAMVRYLDARLLSNGLAQEAIRIKDARTLLCLAAEVCVGVREVGGNNEGPLVELIQETIGGHGKESWCMSFVQTMVAYAELKTELVSPLYATEHCMTCWRETDAIERVKVRPRRGAIVIWKHAGTDSGHTGLVQEDQQSYFYAIEGNTESGIKNGKVERDGGGVYRTKRKKGRIGDMEMVGFLKPF